jgi:hypothetical protein
MWLVVAPASALHLSVGACEKVRGSTEAVGEPTEITVNWDFEGTTSRADAGSDSHPVSNETE